MKLRRGFKAEADSYAREFRAEMRIGASHPLDMFKLAQHLEIPALALSKLKDEIAPHHFRLLTKTSKSPLSALTLFYGRARRIVYNDTHAPTRQQSDMAHELAHAILDHSPSELTNESGGRHYNKELEDEAACLSGVLLIPKEAAIAILASGRSPEQAVEDFNVSLRMIRMRLHQSGAMKIMGRASW